MILQSNDLAIYSSNDQTIWQSNISNVLAMLQSNGIDYKTRAYDVVCEFLHWP